MSTEQTFELEIDDLTYDGKAVRIPLRAVRPIH